MIDRYALRYFLAVIDQGNFSKAASACNVSQPTLSVGIAKLEKTLGRTLFHRTNRRVELTDAGTRLAVYARSIEASFLQAERALADVTVPRTLRLGVLVTTPASWTEPFLRDRRARDGDRVEISEGRERDLNERLNRGRIDVALTILRGEQDARRRVPLLTEGYSLAMSVSHPLAGRATVAADALVNEPMIVRRNCELLSETSSYFTTRGVRPFFAARTFSEARAISYVRNGLGITVMPDGFRSRGMARVGLADFAFTRTIGLIFAPHVDRAGSERRDVVRSLIDAIEARAHDRPDGNDPLSA